MSAAPVAVHAFLAESVAVADGRLFAQGAGFANLRVPALPVHPGRHGVAVLLSVPLSLTGQDIPLALRLEAPDGEPLALADAAIVVTRPNPEDLESVQESLRVAGAQKRKVGVILWQASPDKRVRAVALAREALAAMDADVCPTAISASVSYPYAYAEGLTPQEREPEGRARAELAEVWAWLQRSGIMTAMSYDIMVSRNTDHLDVVPSDHKNRRPRDAAARRKNEASA